jgi:hypothetical protein
MAEEDNFAKVTFIGGDYIEIIKGKKTEYAKSFEINSNKQINETAAKGKTYGTPGAAPKTEIPTDLKVTKVEGPFDENGKKVDKVKKGSFYTYKATPSRKPTVAEVILLKWATKNDNGEIKELIGVSSKNQLSKEGEIIINIAINEDCEIAKIYAYFKKASEKVSAVIVLSLIKIVITKEITGYTIQGLKGEDYIFSDPVVIVPTYKVKVMSYDNKNKLGKYEFNFNVTRDAWYNLGENKNNEYKMLNRAFVPKDWSKNLYGAFWIPSYPNKLRYAKSGMDAFIFTRFGERKIPAKPLETQYKINGEMIDEPRKDENFATDVMIHIGGTYELKGYDHVGGSYGCFGFIPTNDIYSTVSIAKRASESDDYDDISSNSIWKKEANKILNLSFKEQIPLKILLEERDESLNYYPTEVLSE